MWGGFAPQPNGNAGNLAGSVNVGTGSQAQTRGVPEVFGQNPSQLGQQGFGDNFAHSRAWGPNVPGVYDSACGRRRRTSKGARNEGRVAGS